MLHFTSYANQKFDILNKHKVFITKEQVEDALNLPDKTEPKGKYLVYRKDTICVVTKQEGKVTTVITFYPAK